jgi:hypothetical protein
MPEVSLLVRVGMLAFIGALAAAIVVYHGWLDAYLKRHGRLASKPVAVGGASGEERRAPPRPGTLTGA